MEKTAGKPDLRSALFICACFLLTSTGYLAWVYHIMEMVPFRTADAVSMVAGYALQDGREVWVRADFLPGMPEEEWQKQADLRLRDGRNQTLEQLFMGLVHPKLLRFILNRLGLVSEQKRAGVKTEQIRQVLELMRGLDFEIRGLAGYEKAQVTAGGIPLTETDPDTMESLVCPGLYLAGELLDADGICGGYNLQWAMTGGLLAGRAAADKMNHEV